MCYSYQQIKKIFAPRSGKIFFSFYKLNYLPYIMYILIIIKIRPYFKYTNPIINKIQKFALRKISVKWQKNFTFFHVNKFKPNSNLKLSININIFCYTTRKFSVKNDSSNIPLFQIHESQKYIILNPP